ncbi:MAG: V-type ATP synthase subunit K [Actinomycetota bacterium]|nr:V-type ATP synthase subunit K [Actinomycetota bacterium]
MFYLLAAGASGAASASTIGGLTGFQWAILGAALAFAGGGAGSAMGITYVANVGSGILVEDPDKFGPLLPLLAIPGTQGIYGLITAILVTIMFDLPKLSASTGIMVFFSCLPVALVCLVSAAFQGLAAASSSAMVARRTEEAGKALVIPALVETYAVFALILTIYLFTRIG